MDIHLGSIGYFEIEYLQGTTTCIDLQDTILLRLRLHELSAKSLTALISCILMKSMVLSSVEGHIAWIYTIFIHWSHPTTCLDPSKEDLTKEDEPPPAWAAPASPRQLTILVRPGKEIPFCSPYRTHPNKVCMMLMERKRVRAPFTLLTAIERAITVEIAALPDERFISPPPSPSRKRCRLTSSPSSGSPPPPNVLPPRKRLRKFPSPQLDTLTEAIIPEVVILEATTEAILASLRKMVETRRWAFVLDSIVLQVSLGTARVRISDLEIRAEDVEARLQQSEIAQIGDKVRLKRIKNHLGI
ncbi:hypothetical protein Tco_1239381 [Tanacetum coccineum]